MGKRRTKGDGGLTQRHDHPTCPPTIDGQRPAHRCQGRWQGTLDVIVDGRRRRKTVYGRTQKEAKTKLDTAKRDRDKGQLVLATVTVETWMTAWLKRKERTLKPQTIRSYRSKVRTYINPHLGHHRLTSLRGAHIDAMYDAMRTEGLAEATLRQTHAILKRALLDAIRADKLAVNPIEKADAPGTGKARREQFNTTQARIVLAAAKDDARWWLALFYGMRQGECLGLDWSGVDFDRHQLHVEDTLQTDVDGSLILGAPKTELSRRYLPLVPQMEARLRLLWESEGMPRSGLVFHRDGQLIRPRADWQAWRDLIDASTVIPFAPLPHIALHAARNSAASLMEAAGVPARLAMQILGQSQVQTTHRYQSADEDRIREAFGAMGDLLELE